VARKDAVVRFHGADQTTQLGQRFAEGAGAILWKWTLPLTGDWADRSKEERVEWFSVQHLLHLRHQHDTCTGILHSGKLQS